MAQNSRATSGRALVTWHRAALLLLSCILYTRHPRLSSVRSCFCNCDFVRVFGPHHVPVLLATVLAPYCVLPDLAGLTEKTKAELRSRVLFLTYGQGYFHHPVWNTASSDGTTFWNAQILPVTQRKTSSASRPPGPC